MDCLLGRSVPDTSDGAKDRAAYLLWTGFIAFSHHSVQLFVEHHFRMRTVEAEIGGIGQIKKSGVVAPKAHSIQGVIDINDRNAHI